MPTVALASAMVRSAAAMSGRRSSTCEGTPVGTVGGAVSLGSNASATSEAGLPMSVAMACSYCARAMPRLADAAWVAASVFCAWTTEIWVPMPVWYWAWVYSSER